DKGLGVHSHSRLTYALTSPGAPYSRFEALVGLDEKTGGRGSVHIRVLTDGKPRDLGTTRGRKSVTLTGKSEPLAISVTLKGARELTLEVDFGPGGDVGDHVDWVDARLVR